MTEKDLVKTFLKENKKRFDKAKSDFEKHSKEVNKKINKLLAI